MSMSHVYDTVWRWRRRFKQQKAPDDSRGISLFLTSSICQLTIEGNITQPQTTTGVPGPQPDHALNNASWMLTANFEDNAFMNEASFSDFFDSLNWVFDGVPDSIIAPPVL